MTETEPSRERPLNQLSLVAIVVASMIGAGVFTTSGFAVADLRSPHWVMAAWCIGGLIACCGAVSYGHLARLLIDNGGEYLFLTRFVHPAVGFIAGWVSFLAGFTGAGALAAIALEGYALPPDQRPDWLPTGSIAMAAVLIGTLAHAFHTQRGAGTHNLLVFGKLILVGLFIVIALSSLRSWTGSIGRFDEQPTPTVFALATSVMWISLSYCGFNAAIYVAAEAEGGWTVVAGSMIKSTVGVTIIYLLLNAIFLYGPPVDAIAGEQNIAVIAARSISGEPLAMLVRVAICLALASSVSSTIMAGPRVYAKMAQDGVFPAWFESSVSPPTRSVWLQGIAMAMVVSVSQLQDLLGYLGLTLSLCSAATVAILVTRSHGDFRIGRIGSIAAWIYVLATCVIAGLAAWHRPGQATATIMTLVSGGLVYWIIVQVRQRRQPNELQ
ncbi:APC family permease [Neorhodopirellula pilleata]|uniref:Serine/threonine exchanger SteT n=1 Tax=Neorhodopirellula pilleata TaxID=2714738 RepID=A0A5C6A4F0_9BACT|nr:APC family permease [Neorhodopirellula pilleata]TWT94250.1 Serine/threonine exchanger SteT [Neorhodopirellula pilleata]